MAFSEMSKNKIKEAILEQIKLSMVTPYDPWSFEFKSKKEYGEMEVIAKISLKNGSATIKMSFDIDQFKLSKE